MAKTKPHHKVTFTLEDMPDGENVDIRIKFDPPIDGKTRNTPALIIANDILAAIKLHQE